MCSLDKFRHSSCHQCPNFYKELVAAPHFPAPPFQDLREAFRIFDKNRSGYIEAKEIIAVTTTLGEGLTKEELEQFMAEADIDGDGKLNYDEFVKVMTKDWD